VSWRGGRRLGGAAAALLLAGLAQQPALAGDVRAPVSSTGAAPLAQPACTLLLSEHRSERPLLQAPWSTRTLRVSFVHSVLGTPVEDHYVWRDGGWVLVEERFAGEGYGLPHAPAAGEQWLRQDGRTRLLLNRSVMPLVIRPLPAQQMALHLDDGRHWRLAELSAQAIELRTQGC
jgi:hypothetical protein